MKIDVLRVVTRGAAPGERACEGCWEKGRQLRECRIVQCTHGQRDRRGYWRDLCPGCIQKLLAMPALPQAKEKADRAWGNALERLGAKR